MSLLNNLSGIILGGISKILSSELKVLITIQANGKIIIIAIIPSSVYIKIFLNIFTALSP